MKKKKKIPICHLCGKLITEDKTREHVPPRQFFLSRIMKNEKVNLLSLPTHKRCNEKYQLDEEYFFGVIGAMNIDSRFGGEIFYDLKKKFTKEKSKPLLGKILRQIDKEPSGIILPKGQIALRWEINRIENVIWKILKGLYFIEYNQYLNDEVPRRIELIQKPEDLPIEFFIILADKKGHGRHIGLFDYKMDIIIKNDLDTGKLIFHYWALKIWDSVIFTIMFHDPECSCENCNANSIVDK